MADCYTELEKAVVVLVENFYKYVSKHSLVKNKISKSSFRKMLQKELNHMLTVCPPPVGLASPLPASSECSSLGSPWCPHRSLSSHGAQAEPVRALFAFSRETAAQGSILGLCHVFYMEAHWGCCLQYF